MSVVFLTGGSRGIGAGVVDYLVAAGHDVAFTYHERQEEAARVAAAAVVRRPGARCLTYQLDVRDAASVDAVADRVCDDFGGVDVVVLNAGISSAGLAFSLTDQAWTNVIGTNLTGAFFVSRAFLPVFLGAGKGRFIFMSSIAAYGMAGDVAYCASKAGLLGLSSALAKEYGRKGITSNALLLSLFETDMTAAELSREKRDFYFAHSPVGRVGLPSDIGAAIHYLASDGGGFVNGQELGVTGGLDWFH